MENGTLILTRKILKGLLILQFLRLLQISDAADLAIRIPGDLSQQDGIYRLAYSPATPQGLPPNNATFRPQDIGDVIHFSRGLPGTKYDFWLFYSNNSVNDWPAWKASVITTPDPPANLSVLVRSGKVAQVSWDPPAIGGYSSFKLKVVPITEHLTSSVRNIVVEGDASPFALRDLTPGASYKIQLFSLYENKESSAYVSRNFTTKPNTPGRFIVWFRNETTLLVLWQPPYPAGTFSHYRVSIEPADTKDSILYVEKEGEPAGPAQAAFNALIPGRAYNISVQTVSEDQESPPTTAQYRTVPLRPRNVSHDKNTLTSDSFIVRWEGPLGYSEFDRYQVSLGGRKSPPIVVARGEDLKAEFTERLEPGRTYQVVVKTVSGNVASWPAQGNVTTRPLPVRLINATSLPSGELVVTWEPDAGSTQDSFKVTHQEVEAFSGGDASSQVVTTPLFSMATLLPGRNYSISVQSLSAGVESFPNSIFQVTPPASPIIKDFQTIHNGLNISWKSDVTSRQEGYIVSYVRNDTGERGEQRTSESRLVLTDLYAGAGYEVQVIAISHGLRSEPHVYFQAVLPNVPRNLTIVSITNSSALLHWLPPLDSVFSGYIIRYRTNGHLAWTELPVTQPVSQLSLSPLVAGERYTFRVATVSFRVESVETSEAEAALPPNAVTHITTLLDATNITLQWNRPEGRIEATTLTWIEVYENTSGVDPPEEVNHGSRIIPDDSSLSVVNVLIDDLHSGALYEFNIRTTSNEMDSAETKHRVRTRPLIASDISLVSGGHLTDSLALRYTPTPTSFARFDLYRFQLIAAEAPAGTIPMTQEKARDDGDRKVLFQGLVPGRLYNATVWTVSGGVASRPLLRQDRQYPEPVSDINSTDISENSIVLEWKPPRGDYDAFEVQYLNWKGTLSQNLTLQPKVRLFPLRPHRNYTFTLVVVSGTDYTIQRRSSSISAEFTTNEAAPGKVDYFAVERVEPSNAYLTWSLSNGLANGIITGWILKYWPKDIPAISGSKFERHFQPQETHGVIGPLHPGSTYVFEVQASTRVGLGEPVRVEKKMPIWAPPFPGKQIFPTEVSKSSTTIRVRFRRTFFRNSNGPVVNYTVIIAEDSAPSLAEEILGLELPRWSDVQSYSIWPAYQSMEAFNPFGIRNGKEVEDLVIGSESCTGRFGYCNGPLKPGVTYRVKIRAFTAPDKFNDTVYSSPITTDRDSTALILGITVTVVALLLIAVALVAVRVRRGPAGMLCGRHRSTTKAARTWGRNALGDNVSITGTVAETNRPLKLRDFAEHFRLLSADSDFRFSEEFEALKHVGREQQCTAADLPANRPKNRFTNILPYDHSRVKLRPADDDEGSDYINSNYVTGFNSPREFIVTQGPLHSTRDDFWRMCWESGSRSIVMLTRCVEKGREKCDRYWPYDTQPVCYGDIHVQILNESRFPDWNVSEFRVNRGDQSRVMRHFHFTTWPDFGVPEPPQTLVRFVRAFRERCPPDNRPIVVHCSAGVGRSGTFIALDRLLQQMKRTDTIDIFGLVYSMRKERVWMVQTEQQYICIHQCVLAVLEGRETEGMPGVGEHLNQGFEDDEGIAESGM